MVPRVRDCLGGEDNFSFDGEDFVISTAKLR